MSGTNDDELQPTLETAHSLLLRGEWERGLADYERALRLAPDCPAAIFGKACALDRLKKAAEAGVELRRARLSGATSPEEIGYLLKPLERVVDGRDALRAADFDRAMQCFDEALQLYGDNKGALLGKIETLRLMGETRRAFDLLEATPDSNSNDPDFQLQRGWLLLEDQRFRDAEQTFRDLSNNDRCRLLATVGLVASLRHERKLEEAQILIDHLPKSEMDEEAGLHVEAGELRLYGRDFEKARRHFKRAGELAPDSLEAVIGQAKALRGMRRLEEAADVLDHASRPQAIGIHIERGFQALDRGYRALDAREYAEARREFGEALHLDVDNVQAIAGLNSALRSLGETKEAAELVARAAATVDQGVSATLHFDLGKFAYDEHRCEDALREFTKALEADEENREARCWKCRMLRRLRRFAEAEQELQEALALVPADGMLRVEMGWLAFDQRRYCQALQIFEDVYPDLPTRPVEIEALAATLRGLRRWGEVEQLLERYEQGAQSHAHPDEEPTFRAQVLKERGWLDYDRRRFDQAVDRFQEAVKDSPDDLDARRWLAASCREAWDHKRAAEVLSEARKLAPTDPYVRQEQGWLEYDEGRLKEAELLFEEALRFDQTSEGAICGRSAVLRARQDLREAERVTEEGLKCLPGSLALQVELGLVELAAGSLDEAAERLRSVLDDVNDGPDNKGGHNDDLAVAAYIVALTQAADKKAATVAARAVERLPDSPDVHCARGWQLLAAGEDAMNEFKRALELDRRHEGAICGFTQAALRAGKIDVAADTVELAAGTRANPYLVKALAMVRFKQRRYEQAIQELTREILQNDPEAWQWRCANLRMLRRFDEAASTARDGLERLGDHIGLRLELARSLFGQREYRDAEREFDRVHRENPDKEDAVIGKSECLRRLRRHAVAASLVSKALERSGSHMLRLERGRIALELGLHTEAGRLFQQVLDAADAAAKDEAAAYSGQAIIQAEQDEWVQADHLFHKACETDPSSVGHRVLHGWYLVRRDEYEHRRRPGMDDYLDKAEQHCEDALTMDEHCAPAFACLGVIAHRRKQFQMAEELLRRAVEIDRHSSYYVQHAAVLSETGRCEKAEEQLRTYLGFSWHDTHAHAQLGTVLLRTRRPAEAADEFHVACTLAPDNMSAAAQLAVALMQDGRPEEAQEHLRSCLERAKDGDGDTLRVLLAWVLITRGDQLVRPDFYEDALRALANGKRPGEAAELHRWAALAHIRLAKVGPQSFRPWHRHQAQQAMDKFDQVYGNTHAGDLAEAQLLRRDLRWRASAALGAGTFIAGLSLALLLVLWIAFLAGADNLTGTVVASMTPVLIALALIASVLPVVSRLHVAGVEAELREPPAISEESIRPIDFRQITAVVTAQQTLTADVPELTEHLPEEVVAYLLPARPVTTSSKVQEPPSPLTEILRPPRPSE